jgi:hypothetical protein
VNITEPGQPNGAVLKLAFWEAMRRCDTDERIHAMETLYFNRVDRDGGDQLIDGYLPKEVWEHMATAIQELRIAAGLTDP